MSAWRIRLPQKDWRWRDTSERSRWRIRLPKRSEGLAAAGARRDTSERSRWRACLSVQKDWQPA